jgi:hypothetical protein
MVDRGKNAAYPKRGKSMESQHEQLPQDEREQYEAPAGEELGTVADLTASTCFPSCPQP